jgi:hypothetical protein
MRLLQVRDHRGVDLDQISVDQWTIRMVQMVHPARGVPGSSFRLSRPFSLPRISRAAEGIVWLLALLRLLPSSP